MSLPALVVVVFRGIINQAHCRIRNAAGLCRTFRASRHCFRRNIQEVGLHAQAVHRILVCQTVASLQRLGQCARLGRKAGRKSPENIAGHEIIGRIGALAEEARRQGELSIRGLGIRELLLEYLPNLGLGFRLLGIGGNRRLLGLASAVGGLFTAGFAIDFRGSAAGSWRSFLLRRGRLQCVGSRHRPFLDLRLCRRFGRFRRRFRRWRGFGRRGRLGELRGGSFP